MAFVTSVTVLEYRIYHFPHNTNDFESNLGNFIAGLSWAPMAFNTFIQITSILWKNRDTPN